jgi:hypothetical protein
VILGERTEHAKRSQTENQKKTCTQDETKAQHNLIGFEIIYFDERDGDIKCVRQETFIASRNWAWI